MVSLFCFVGAIVAGFYTHVEGVIRFLLWQNLSLSNFSLPADADAPPGRRRAVVLCARRQNMFSISVEHSALQQL